MRYFSLDQRGGQTDGYPYSHLTSMAKNRDNTDSINADSYISWSYSIPFYQTWQAERRSLAENLIRQRQSAVSLVYSANWPPDAHFLEAELPTPGPLAARPGPLCCETEGVYKMTPPASSVWEEGTHAKNIFHIFLQGWGNGELLENKVMCMGKLGLF